MLIKRTYLIFVLFSFFAVAYKSLIYISYPSIARLTDFSNYDAIFRGDAEDVGFYPVYIAIKNIFVYFGIPFPVFQIIVSSLYTISICTFMLLSLRSLKLKSRSIVMASVAIAILYSLLSYSSLKSFSLVKLYLSISILGFSCFIVRPNLVRLVSPSLFNLVGALLASPQTLPALLLYLNDGLRQSLLLVYNKLRSSRIAKLSLSSKKLFTLIALVLTLFIIWSLVSISPLLADGTGEIFSILLTSILDKLTAYLPSESLNLLFTLIFFILILILLLCFWMRSLYLLLPTVSLLFVSLFGLNRFSPLIPFFLFSLISQRPLICICLLDLFLSYETIKGIGLLI